MEITNPAFDYNAFGQTYSGHRRTDPRIAAYVNTALGNAKTILNVGAGGGSYEPDDAYVVAIEPSLVMRQQRKGNNKVPAINAKADDLPFDNNAFDASMAMVTVHHWPDIKKGLEEMRRVTSGQVIIMTFDPDALDDFWNARYFPELIAVEKARYPKTAFIMEALGSHCEVMLFRFRWIVQMVFRKHFTEGLRHSCRKRCACRNLPGDFCPKEPKPD